jgi:hypothetical protein
MEIVGRHGKVSTNTVTFNQMYNTQRAKTIKQYHIKYDNTYAVRESQPLEPAKRKAQFNAKFHTVHSIPHTALVWSG